MRDRERVRLAETQAEGEAGCMQGAQCGNRSWVSRMTPWAAGSAKPLSHPGIPNTNFFKLHHEISYQHKNDLSMANIVTFHVEKKKIFAFMQKTSIGTPL